MGDDILMLSPIFFDVQETSTLTRGDGQIWSAPTWRRTPYWARTILKMVAQRLTVQNQPVDEEKFDLLIEAGRTEKHYWADLWRYRELFLILAWRDVMVRYKQTVAGAAWAVLQPLLSMIIMTVIFSRVAGLPSEGTAPYALMV